MEKQRHNNKENSANSDGFDGGITTSTANSFQSEYPQPMLSEDYAEIGLGEEEGDYSTPAARNYELDRSQISLNEIIGVGQFGDVHIGTCRIKNHKKSNTDDEDDRKSGGSQSSLNGGDSSSINNGDNNNENNKKLGVIHVAVKTCKADADITTSEKFLEEACKINFFSKTI